MVSTGRRLALWLWLSGRPPGDSSAEVGFARGMLVHHAQAVEMAEIIRDRSDSNDMRLSRLGISITQQAQIGIIQGWIGA